MLFSLFSASLYSQKEEVVREIIAHNKDSVFRYVFLFDDYNNKVVENKYYLDQDKTSLPLLRTEWVYEENHCVLQRQQRWVDERWDTYYLIESTYVDSTQKVESFIAVADTTAQVEKTILHQYEGGLLQSIKRYKGEITEQQLVETKSFSYDTLNLLRLMQIDRLSTHNTSLQQVFNYVYDTTGRLDSLIYTDRQDSSIIERQLTLFVYDEVDRLINQTHKQYNLYSHKWERQSKSTFEYNAGGQLTQEIYSHFSGAFWTPNIRYAYNYDGRNLLQSKVMYQIRYREWRKMHTIEYSQIEHNQPNLMESKYNFWGGIAGEYLNNFIPYYFNNEIYLMKAHRMEINYTVDYSELKPVTLKTGWLQIYPNPSNGVFYINTQRYNIKSWEVYDLHGMKIKGETNHFRTGIVDLSEFSDGIYMIRATTNDDKQFQQKIIIQGNQ